MHPTLLRDPFHGLFDWQPSAPASRDLRPAADRPGAVPDPETGRPLKVASVEVSDRGVCPACAKPGRGGYVSFVSDLRLAFAYTLCQRLVWITGA